MLPSLDFTFTDHATPALASLAAQMTHLRPLHAAMGKRAEIELRDHFQTRDAEPNKMGWASLHFWGRMRKATALGRVDDAGATVVISDPAMNQKVFGGTITAKEGKFLSIPARQEAYGRSPRMFSDLHFVALSGGRGMLVQHYSTALTYFKRGKKEGQIKSKTEQGGGVFYWLVKSVTQTADERALPEAEGFRAALLEEAQAYFDRQPG